MPQSARAIPPSPVADGDSSGSTSPSGPTSPSTTSTSAEVNTRAQGAAVQGASASSSMRSARRRRSSSFSSRGDSSIAWKSWPRRRFSRTPRMKPEITIKSEVMQAPVP